MIARSLDSRRRLRVALLPALAVVAVAALSGCGAAGARKTDAPGDAAALLAPADVGVASRTDLAAGVPVSGALDPAVDVRVTAPFDDVLAEVTVKEGERVREGEVLARFRVSTVGPAAASAKAALDLAKADAERYRNLLAEGAVSQRDADAAEAQYRAAAANEAQARRVFDDASVRSPVSGVVATRSVQGGDRVKSGDPMFRIVNTAELEFAASVPAEYAPQVKAGAPVTLDLSGFPHGAITGRVARVNATTDASTRQVQVYVRVANGDGRLVGGLFATGAIVTTESREAVAVPASAVHDEGQQRYVYAVARGRIERRIVDTGVRDQARDLAEIRSGLAAGDSVIVGAIEGLTPGQRVSVAAGVADTTTSARR